jgi:transposase
MAAILVNSMNPKRTRRRFTAAFKAEVALTALTERHPLAELATRYQLSVEQISRWKTQLRQQAEQVFAEPGPVAAAAPDVEPLYAAIGRLQMENQLLKKTLPPCA